MILDGAWQILGKFIYHRAKRAYPSFTLSFWRFSERLNVIVTTFSSTQCLLTWSRKIRLFEPSEGIFRDPTKYWTTKKVCKIGTLGPKEKIDFISFFLMRKRLSSGQKGFLRPYFLLKRGVFVFRIGLRFSFRTLEVPEPRVRKRSF